MQENETEKIWLSAPNLWLRNTYQSLFSLCPDSFPGANRPGLSCSWLLFVPDLIFANIRSQHYSCFSNYKTKVQRRDMIPQVKLIQQDKRDWITWIHTLVPFSQLHMASSQRREEEQWNRSRGVWWGADGGILRIPLFTQEGYLNLGDNFSESTLKHLNHSHVKHHY